MIVIMNSVAKKKCSIAGDVEHSSLTVALWVLFFFCSILPLPLPNGYDWVIAMLLCLAIFLKGICSFLRNAVDTPIANPWILLVQVIGVSFLLTFALFVKVTFLFYAVSFCLVIPLIYLTFQENGIAGIISAMARGFNVAFWILVVLSFFFGPAYSAGVQYSSFFSDPNVLGYVITSVMPCTGYLFIGALREGGQRKLVYAAALAVQVTMALMTASRTTTLSLVPQIAVIAVVAFRVLRARNDFRTKRVLILRSVVSCLLTFVLAASATLGLFTFGKSAIDGSLTADGPSNALTQGSNSGFSAMLESNVRRYSKGLDTGNYNDFSSGRLGIWASFLQDIEPLGHESETKPVVSGSRNYDFIYAHNVFIQVAYSGGLFAGVSMCLIMLISLIQAGAMVLGGKSAARHSLSPELVTFFACVVFGYFIYAFLGNGYAMFKYLPASVFWIASAALYASCRTPECRECCRNQSRQLS